MLLVVMMLEGTKIVHDKSRKEFQCIVTELEGLLLAGGRMGAIGGDNVGRNEACCLRRVPNK
jgi:hypothetical protein